MIPAKSGVHSVHDVLRQVEKVSKLVALIDARATAQGIDPQHGAARIARSVRVFNFGHWITLAHHAGVTVPDATERALIENTYERRVRALRESVA